MNIATCSSTEVWMLSSNKPLPLRLFTSATNGVLFHPEHLESLYIVLGVDAVQFTYPLLISGQHTPVHDTRKSSEPNRSLAQHEDPSMNDNY
jgi:hypothetical protein